MTRTPEEVVGALAAVAGLAPFDETSTWQDALFDGEALRLPDEPDRVLLAALAEEYAQLDEHAATVVDRAHQDWLERILGIPRLPVVPDRVVAHATIDPKVAPAVLPVGTLLRGGKDLAKRERRYATLDVLTAHGAALAGLRSLVPGGNPAGRPGAAASAPEFPLEPRLGPNAPHTLRIWSPALVFSGGTMGVDISFKDASGVAALTGVMWRCSLPDGSPGDPTVGIVSGDTVSLALKEKCGAPDGEVAWIEAVVPAHVDVPETLSFTGVDIAVTSRSEVVPQAGFYNDGAVDVSKEFQPFGAVAKRGDAFYLRCDEAFGKAVDEVTVTVSVMAEEGAPLFLSVGGSGVPTYVYNEVSQQIVQLKKLLGLSSQNVLDKLDLIDGYLGDRGDAQVVWQRRVKGGWQGVGDPSSAFTGVQATIADDIASEPVSISGQPGHYLRAFLSKGDFGWTDYQEKVAAFATKAVAGTTPKPTMPVPPVPPIASAITVRYTTLPVAATRVESVSGWRRAEQPPTGSFHPFRRAVDDSGATGMVALGLELPDRALGSTVSVWFDIDSASPCGVADDVPARWESWTGTAWQPLPVADGSRGLRESGLVRFVAPQGWPSGCAGVDAVSGRWIRLVTEAPGMLGVIRGVTTDAVVASFVSAEADPETDPSHDALLPPGTIKGTVSPVPGVKKVTNLSSVRGRGPEDDRGYRRRASALARHRGRAVAAWDYEQHVALGFPEIAAVRCLPHTRSDGTRRAGSVGVLVLPDRPDEPTPRPSVSLTGRITDLLRPLMPVGADVAVVCPLYAPVSVVATITLNRGVAALIGLETITTRLDALLHPVTPGPARWGVTLYASSLVAAMERMEVVEVVTSFELRNEAGDAVEVVEVDPCRGLYCSSGAHTLTVEEQL
ncbi:hypothetical protein D0Z08_30195 [Nocardioides immobilis]|uniref:Uncharacterized protein n=1 Tax=Nocardioides immobilis TaxID=2049295 RepID=A0A417XSP0_9ACTN|nr:baseplate J/gp47 family protein [Nocardioides immobilis]RHW23363.1 hypothetical protein D0Z08_30195 [Nocardioides immobilis]